MVSRAQTPKCSSMPSDRARSSSITAAAIRILRSAPGLEDIWQLHFSLLSGQEFAAPEKFIANEFDDQTAKLPAAPLVVPPGATGLPPPPAHEGKAYWIKVSAQTNGEF